MKKHALILILSSCWLIVGYGQITGSAHDFSGVSWANNQICIVCHTPHNGMTVLDAPLWSHEQSTAAYALYASPTFDGSATIGQPSGNSKLCLSCHDGTVALENFGGITTGTTFITGSALVGGGGDLSRDHPISFIYNDALAVADGGLSAPTTTNSGLGGTIDEDLLYANRMECASCHDVHNKYGHSHLLIMSNAGSALCLTCHTK